MPTYRNTEDACYRACTSPGLRRAADDGQRELCPYRSGEIRRALDRLYRRRRFVPDKMHEGYHTSARPPRNSVERTAGLLRAFGPLSDEVASPIAVYPHV